MDERLLYKDRDFMKKHEKDTGSVQVQIINLTSDIARLAAHLNENKKDYSSKRTILKKVAQRNRFLKYLERTDLETYRAVLAQVKRAA